MRHTWAGESLLWWSHRRGIGDGGKSLAAALLGVSSLDLAPPVTLRGHFSSEWWSVGWVERSDTHQLDNGSLKDDGYRFAPPILQTPILQKRRAGTRPARTT